MRGGYVIIHVIEKQLHKSTQGLSHSIQQLQTQLVRNIISFHLRLFLPQPWVLDQ